MGRFIGENFEATYQKVGTFQIVNGQKQGGNVASYFCLSDGTVIHAVAGPLDARRFLREAKWAADIRKLAMTEADGDVNTYRATIRKAHMERLAADYGYQPVNLPAIRGVPTDRFAPCARSAPKQGQAAVPPPVPTKAPLQQIHPGHPFCGNGRMDNQGRVHLVLANYPLPKLAQLYPIVFQDILKEKISTLPVQSR